MDFVGQYFSVEQYQVLESPTFFGCFFGCCGWTVLVVHTVYLGGSFGGALCLGEAVNWVSRDSVRLLLITYWISFSFFQLD
jgi:hypothetical protein